LPPEALRKQLEKRAVELPTKPRPAAAAA